MKRILVLSAVALLIFASLFAVVNYTSSNGPKEKKPFYVGVTFCGATTRDAMMLVDKVKNYTNLFVLQSGALILNGTAVNEIGDYAVLNGLHFAAYIDTLSNPKQASWLEVAQQRWGKMFAGVYYGDEPGGKMLDDYVNLSNDPSQGIFTKLGNGGLLVGAITFMPNGTITVSKTAGSLPDPSFFSDNDKNESSSNNTSIDTFESNFNYTTIIYYPNGSIAIDEKLTSAVYYTNGSIVTKEKISNLFTSENSTDRISNVQSYQEVLSKNPIPNCDAAAENFVTRNQKTLEGLSRQWSLANRSFPIFTADYALYWWDFQSGYDLVLAELGWNNTVAQEIGLVRGAANLQGKQWGTIITWTYTKFPYLADGSKLYEQMRMSYESGAEYVIIFNYAEDMGGPFGTLQNEHFVALERFWKEVVQNSDVLPGGVKAEAVFVLPKNYGWGLRNIQDTVWGLWTPTEEAQQAFSRLKGALVKHDLRLDIVFEDPAFPLDEKYTSVYYWNQTD